MAMNSLLRNVAYNIAGQGFVLSLTFVAVRFIFRALGDDAFGLIYFSLLVITVVVSALELGIGSTAVREVAAHASTDPSYVRDFVRASSLLFWTLFVLAAVVLYLVAPWLVLRWITLRSMSPDLAIAVLRILGIAGLLNLPRVLYTSLLRGR